VRNLKWYCKKNLPDTISVVEIKWIKEPWCGNIFGYDASVFLNYMNPNIRTIGITYRNLSYHCTDEMLDGLTLGKNSVVTIYNVGTVKRLSKICMHELGHTYNLNHCESKHCFMEAGGFSFSQQMRMYDTEVYFCKKCKKLLNEKVLNNR
jgi:hypothetical protein